MLHSTNQLSSLIQELGRQNPIYSWRTRIVALYLPIVIALLSHVALKIVVLFELRISSNLVNGHESTDINLSREIPLLVGLNRTV